MAHNRPHITAPPPPLNLQTILNRERTQLNRILDFEGPLVVDDDEAPVVGCLYSALIANRQLEDLTNQTQDKLLRVYQNALPFFADQARRGPKPKSSDIDQLICYLAWIKLGIESSVLSKLLDMKENRLDDNINRIRPILNMTLRFLWWSPRSRPIFQDTSPFPHAALLIDGHTTQCHRPKAPFEEAKIYYDKKNHIYGLKNEVACDATPPHYCKFVLPKDVGSVHDYTINKNNYQSYLEYLLKTPEEMLHLQADVQFRYWASVLDKAYTGPQQDTPDFRRIVPHKGANLSHAQRTHNDHVNAVRVPIECLFGRNMQLHGVVRGIYRWDHLHFQMDVENSFLLTNENIMVCYCTLAPSDLYFIYIFYIYSLTCI